jgi:hypothetical protein
VVFSFSFGGDGGADLGEGGRDVGRRVLEDGPGVADVDADELDASPISSKGLKEGILFLGLLAELLLTAEVPAKTDLEEDEETFHEVEGFGVWSGVGWLSSGVNDVRGGSHSWRHQAVEVFL